MIQHRFSASLSVLAFAVSLVVLAPSSSSAYSGGLPPVDVTGVAGVNGTAELPAGGNGGGATIISPSPYRSLRGGAGGDGYNDPMGLIVGLGGNGGNASLDLNFDVLSNSAFYLRSFGGQGGIGYGASGGDGGNADQFKFEAFANNDFSIQVRSSQVGGDGGQSFGGDGGKGANASADNSIRGFTKGDLVFEQGATGGAGGTSDGGNAGSAGKARSLLSFGDKEASAIVAHTKAFGGMGGGATAGGIGSAGGNADAITNIVGEFANTLHVSASAQGGDGYRGTLDRFGLNPDVDHYRGGASGGDARARADGVGIGGVVVEAMAQGGDGSRASGLGLTSGSGGKADASAFGTSRNGGSVDVVVIAQGGNGGSGYNDASTGDGADVYLENAAGGYTTGALYLQQEAIAGSAGSFLPTSLTNGAGAQGKNGSATSIIGFVDGAASSLSVYSSAEAGYSMWSPSGSATSDAWVESTKVGATADVYSVASSRTANPFPSISMSRSIAPMMSFSGSSATASATGVGTQTLIKSMAQAYGDSASADSSSYVYDLDGNSVRTTAFNRQSKDEVSAATTAIIGDANYQIYSEGYSPNVKSYGNLTAVSPKPVKLTELGTTKADYTVVADGAMGATYDFDDSAPQSFSTSASYMFTSLSVGQDLLFGLTDQNVFGTGFQSATFSITQDGNSVFNSSFSSMAEWTNFFEKPLYFGPMIVEGPVSFDIALTQMLMGSGNGYVMNYALVVAPEGTVTGQYTDLANVPLPAAAPLFGAALVGLGALRQRRKKADKARAA